jgi:hypothetical protein
MQVLASVSADRRAIQRIDVLIPATLEDRLQLRYAGTLRNISLSGVLLSVESADMPRLLPNTPSREHRSPAIFNLEFIAPVLHDRGPVRVSCSIAHVRRTSGDTCLLGLNFREFGAGRLAILEEFWLGQLAAVALGDRDL